MSGKVTKIALEAHISVVARRDTEHMFKTMTQRAKDHFVKDDQYINGVPGTFSLFYAARRDGYWC